MSTKLKKQFTFNCDPQAAYELLTSTDYAQEKNERTGGSDVSVNATDNGAGTTLVVERTLPANVPSFAKKFVGETITTVQTDEWSAADADGTRTVTSHVEFKGSPLEVNGKYVLKGDSNGSVMDIEFDIKAKVPLVGGKLEKVVLGETERAVVAEQEIIDEKLA